MLAACLPLSLGAVSPGVITDGSTLLRAGGADKAHDHWVLPPKMLTPWVIRKHYLKPLIRLSIPFLTVNISAAGIWQEFKLYVEIQRAKGQE